MLEETHAVNMVLGGTGGAAALFVLIKFFAKQGFGGLLDVKEMGARADIIADLRADIERLKEDRDEDRSRIGQLETKVGKLQDRLVVVRTHALTIYGIVQTWCKSCSGNRNQEILDLLAAIIRED